MSNRADPLEQEINQIYRSSYGKIVASLLYFSSDIDLETAEDIVQDAFASALTVWRNDGLPANPAGWIFRGCRNNALNKIKQRKRVSSIADRDFHGEEYQFPEAVLDDQQLKLLFACAHPDLSPKVQVILTLKYVANLKVEAIARVFGMSVDGIDKLLVRARQKIRDEKILLEFPGLPTLKNRLPIVHKIIYLVYTEGYKCSWGKEILREELCEEALLMNKELLDSGIGNNDTAALQALMLFNASRFKARFSPNGEMLDLEEQDRSLWNVDLILLACKSLKQSQGESISSYHLEASIACLHSSAKSFHTTDWDSISSLYLQLLKLNPNPFVELNYAIALYYAGQKLKALKILNDLRQKPFLNQYYLLNATLGKIHLLEGNPVKAREFLSDALEQANFETERAFIRKMILKIID